MGTQFLLEGIALAGSFKQDVEHYFVNRSLIISWRNLIACQFPLALAAQINPRYLQKIYKPIRRGLFGMARGYMLSRPVHFMGGDYFGVKITKEKFQKSDYQYKGDLYICCMGQKLIEEASF